MKYPDSFIRRGLHRTAAAAVCVLVMSGCVLVDPDYRYGYVAFEGADVHDTGTAVRIPPNAPTISQRYKPVRTTRGGEQIERAHEGFDIIAKNGTPVIAPADGVVVDSYWEPMFGNRLLVDHGVFDGVRMYTRYYHLKKRLVEKGARVVRGQQIARLGRTGVLAPSPHLHFETRNDVEIGSRTVNQPLNPHFFWWDGRGRVTCYDARRDWTTDAFRLTYPVPCRDTPWQ